MLEPGHHRGAAYVPDPVAAGTGAAGTGGAGTKHELYATASTAVQDTWNGYWTEMSAFAVDSAGNVVVAQKKKDTNSDGSLIRLMRGGGVVESGGGAQFDAPVRFLARDTPEDVIFLSTGELAVAANGESSAPTVSFISAYKTCLFDSGCSPVQTTAVPDPFLLADDPANRFVYVLTVSGQLWRIPCKISK